MLKRLMVGWLLTVAGLLNAPTVWAEDLAVLIVNEMYQNHPRVRGVSAIDRLEEPLRGAGFEVVALRNMRRAPTESAGEELWNRMFRADRLIVVLSGHFVRTGPAAWLLYTGAERPNSFTVGDAALPLAAVLDAAARHPGRAAVAVALGGSEIDNGPGVFRFGFPAEIPQGVTYVQGAPDEVARFVSDELLARDRSLAEAARAVESGLRVEGYLPKEPFLPPAAAGDATADDRAVWNRARQTGTLQAYREYLARFPRGMFAEQAQARIEELSLTPQDRARIEEESLNLSRDQRRSIQRNLTLLGFDTFGIDGLFGRRTRQAAADWQKDQGLPATGYLSGNQIALLDRTAAARARELEAEAERKRIETQRRDREYWNKTGADGTEESLRAYLERYPDGEFSDQAREKLDVFERAARRRAEREDLGAWDRAVMAGTQQSYRAYLEAYPQGRFADAARSRIARLSQPETPPDVIDAARREEQSLEFNATTRSLIEAQLDRLGFDPGRADGKFDEQTRRALRRYQRDNGLPVTGFLTRAVVVRLLASAMQR